MRLIFNFFSYRYLLFAEQILWANSWSEEWVVLYDDSTIAWFTVSYQISKFDYVSKQMRA